MCILRGVGRVRCASVRRSVGGQEKSEGGRVRGEG